MAKVVEDENGNPVMAFLGSEKHRTAVVNPRDAKDVPLFRAMVNGKEVVFERLVPPGGYLPLDEA